MYIRYTYVMVIVFSAHCVLSYHVIISGLHVILVCLCRIPRIHHKFCFGGDTPLKLRLKHSSCDGELLDIQHDIILKVTR